MTIRTLTKLGAVMAFAIVLSGCALSIDAVVSESDALFDPGLLGSWEEVTGSDRATISRAAENMYAIEYTDGEGKVENYEARLGRLGERLVLDVWPAPRETDLPLPYVGFLIAGHLLLTLDVGPDEIRVAALDPDSLLAALDAGEIHLAHGRSGDQLILYGTTEDLRSALGAYVARSGALREPDVWRRAQ